MYELITENEGRRIKKILVEAGLSEDINISVLDGKYKVDAYNVSESYQTERFGYDMQEFYLMDREEGAEVLEYKNKKYEVFLNIGEWGYKTDFDGCHITVGSSKFHEYSFQLELSQAVKDNNNIYIIKNITNLSGKGALVRLYRGLGTDKEKKRMRVEAFVEAFNNDVLKFQGKEWVVLSKIPLSDLNDDEKEEDIYQNVLESIVKAMLLVEGIGEEIK